MADAVKRKLQIPPHQIPYLEKHNIFKLFHELGRALVIQQPDDHVFAVKCMLTNAVNSIGVPHVVLLGSPQLNIVEIAVQICATTKLTLITGEMIKSLLNLNHREQAKSAEVVLALQAIISSKSSDIAEHGWIMVNCIRTKKEAQHLLDAGILPTHVFYLISPYCPKLTQLLYHEAIPNWPKFRRNMSGILNVFHKKLIEIYIDDMHLKEVAAKCAELAYVEHIEKGPKQLRLLILGPRGCGRKTQAKLLAQKLNIIHIDYEYLLCQVWISESQLGQKLRACGDKACLESAILTKILNKRILEKDCMKQGWVLTGFPFCVLDMKYFDCLETPPNRIVFLECDLNICLERILKRTCNVHTGSMTNVMEVAEHELAAKRLKFHPKDKADLVNAELQYYCTQYGSLRKYCGTTAFVINGAQSERWVHEKICGAVMRDLPSVQCRDPFQGAEPTEADLRVAMPYLFFTPE